MYELLLCGSGILKCRNMYVWKIIAYVYLCFVGTDLLIACICHTCLYNVYINILAYAYIHVHVYVWYTCVHVWCIISRDTNKIFLCWKQHTLWGAGGGYTYKYSTRCLCVYISWILIIIFECRQMVAKKAIVFTHVGLQAQQMCALSMCVCVCVRACLRVYIAYVCVLNSWGTCYFHACRFLSVRYV
jgi:hypothetical protein